MESTHRVTRAHERCRERWLEQIGEVTLIGGWAEVALDDDFAALIDPPHYQVFVAAYDPVQLFVQNRTARSLEIHALTGRVRAAAAPRCAYRVVGIAAGRAGG